MSGVIDREIRITEGATGKMATGSVVRIADTCTVGSIARTADGSAMKTVSGSMVKSAADSMENTVDVSMVKTADDSVVGTAGASVVIGVDVGGTKVATGLINSEGKILAEINEALEASEADPEITILQVVRHIRTICAEAGLEKIPPIGVGIPAVVSREDGVVIWTPNIPAWRDLPLCSRLSRHLGTTDISIDFDGNTAVLAEAWIGAGRGKKNVVCLIIGTGVGSGYVLEGRLYRGSSYIPGAVGWWALDPELVPEAMSRRIPSFESLCSGPSLIRIANERADRVKGAKRYPDTYALFAGYDEGEPGAVEVLNRAISYVGMGCANLVTAFNPDVLVIGGGIGLEYCRRPKLYGEICKTVNNISQPIAAQHVKIVPAELGRVAGMVGAAKLAFDDFGYQ
ncbi:MAG: ROK family protein [Bacillota bacterium]|jgi:glucokinase